MTPQQLVVQLIDAQVAEATTVAPLFELHSISQMKHWREASGLLITVHKETAQQDAPIV